MFDLVFLNLNGVFDHLDSIKTTSVLDLFLWEDICYNTLHSKSNMKFCEIL